MLRVARRRVEGLTLSKVRQRRAETGLRCYIGPAAIIRSIFRAV